MFGAVNIVLNRERTDQLFLCLFTSDEDNLVARFRGNLIINGGKAFEEESWDAVKFGNMKFLVSWTSVFCY